jgi:hypothetical protein
VNLPRKLCRRAIKKSFLKISERTWEYLFDVEERNGLYSCRINSRGRKKIYYSTSRLIEWLVNEGYYTQVEFEGNPNAGRWSGLVRRTHAFAL